MLSLMLSIIEWLLRAHARVGAFDVTRTKDGGTLAQTKHTKASNKLEIENNKVFIEIKIIVIKWN